MPLKVRTVGRLHSLHNILVAKLEIGNCMGSSEPLSHNGPMAHHFLCFLYQAELMVAKNRIEPQRQAVHVSRVGDKGYPVAVARILFSARRDIYAYCIY